MSAATLASPAVLCPKPPACQHASKKNQLPIQKTGLKDKQSLAIHTFLPLPLSQSGIKTAKRTYTYLINPLNCEVTQYKMTEILKNNQRVYNSAKFDAVKRIAASGEKSIYLLQSRVPFLNKIKNKTLHYYKNHDLKMARGIVKWTQFFYNQSLKTARSEDRPVGIAKPFKAAFNAPENSRSACLVMPYYQADLHSIVNLDWMRDHLGISLWKNSVLTIFYNILCGAANIHAAGLIHGDIKPENIFVRFKHNKLEIAIADYVNSTTADDPKLIPMTPGFFLVEERIRFLASQDKEERAFLLRKMDAYAVGKTLSEVLEAADIEDSLKSELNAFIQTKLLVPEIGQRAELTDALEQFLNIILANNLQHTLSKHLNKERSTKG